MNKFYRNASLLILLSIHTVCHAQTVFWTENFNNGCTSNCYANAYSGVNGAWSTVNTGTNNAKANQWFISCAENGEPVGSCGAGCGSNPTLHVGCLSAFIVCPNGDCGAAYNATGTSNITDKLCYSPLIDCTAKSTITLSFKYIGKGQSCTTDYCDLEYSPDSGSTWSNLQTCLTAPKCSGQGQWTAFSIAMPASANNNPNVMIGFHWVNNGDGVGTDPSFAVDDITLSIPSATLPPVANFSASKTTLCPNSCINYTDISTNNPTSWMWTFNGGTPSTSSLQNPGNICYSTGGNYNVTLVASNSSGIDSLTISSYITVNHPPLSSASNSSPVCSGSTLNLSSGGGSSYSWTGPNAFSSNQQNPSRANIVLADSGIYTVIVTGTGGCTATASTSVSINPSPTSSTASSNSPLCLGSALALNTGGGTSYSWSGPNGFNSLQQNPGISNSSFSDSGTYIVTVTGANDCTATASTVVNINPLPVASDSSNSPVCFSGELDLYASGGASYSWQGPNGFTSSDQNPLIIEALKANSGIFSVMVTDANGCTSTTSISVIVFPPVPTPNIVQVSVDTLYCSTDPSYISYQWYDSTQLINGATDTLLVINKGGNYNVQVANANGCKVAVGINVILMGINHLMEPGFISLIPNPASDKITIHAVSFYAEKAITVSIVNLLGETVRQEQFKGSIDNEINVIALSAGIYFLQMKWEDGNIARRFVKE